MTGSIGDIDYAWRNHASLDKAALEECAELFSNHYGQWSLLSGRSGNRIALSPARIGDLLTGRGASVSLARAGGKLVGHALSVRIPVAGNGRIAWVTQLVVHRDYRRHGIATTLLNSVWAFSNDFAWGLVTANPFTVLTLEKATRRRCNPAIIRRFENEIALAAKSIPYTRSARIDIAAGRSVIDTQFPIDHSELDRMLKDVGRRWKLGRLQEGQEWLAFTFRKQPRKPLTASDLESLLAQSERILQEAYSRMRLDESHRWAAHAGAEVEQVLGMIDAPASGKVLDFGCGAGRHTIEFAKRGYAATGLDSIANFVERARENARKQGAGARFEIGDCRTARLGELFDLGFCVYDVIGSYAQAADNAAILANLVSHVKPGGFVVLSVMNMALTKSIAKHRGDVFGDPDVLQRLKPANIMQSSGEVFDPDHFLLDTKSGIVYRKEQFSEDDLLSSELIVRDRRYMPAEVQDMCRAAGLTEIRCHCVRAGRWSEPLEPEARNAKEVLYVGRKAAA